MTAELNLKYKKGATTTRFGRDDASPFRVREGGVVHGIRLVDVGDPAATSVHCRHGGVVKAWARGSVITNSVGFGTLTFLKTLVSGGEVLPPLGRLPMAGYNATELFCKNGKVNWATGAFSYYADIAVRDYAAVNDTNLFGLSTAYGTTRLLSVYDLNATLITSWSDHPALTGYPICCDELGYIYQAKYTENSGTGFYRMSILKWDSATGALVSQTNGPDFTLGSYGIPRAIDYHPTGGLYFVYRYPPRTGPSMICDSSFNTVYTLLSSAQINGLAVDATNLYISTSDNNLTKLTSAGAVVASVAAGVYGILRATP